MLDKRKVPGAGGAGDPSKDDSAERPSNSKKDNRSKVLSDHREAIDFLEKLRPGGPWVLTAIDPASGKIETITAHNKTEARDFIRRHDGKRNLYYSVNPTRTAMTRKAAKTDIAAIEYLFADLDPRDDESPEDAKSRYLKTLETFKPTPTAIIDSGNGIQVLWRLEKPIALSDPVSGKYLPEDEAKIADAEARSASLMARLGLRRHQHEEHRPHPARAGHDQPAEQKEDQGGASCLPDEIDQLQRL